MEQQKEHGLLPAGLDLGPFVVQPAASVISCGYSDDALVTAAVTARPNGVATGNASRVMVDEFLSLMYCRRWIIRQDYRDPSTRPAPAGVTGILDSRRDPGCCAASRVDRLR